MAFILHVLEHVGYYTRLRNVLAGTTELENTGRESSTKNTYLLETKSMTQTIRTVISIALGLLLAVSLSVQAQQPSRFLTLSPPDGLPIIPVLEGWVANEDGSRSFVFGYINRNDTAVDIPIGENNYMEPAEFNGMQPTHFDTRRGPQVFTVTVPADRADEDVWWYVKTGDSEVLKVPGRARDSAYEIDFIRPRPQGSLQPMVGFGENGQRARGNQALVEDFSGQVTAGEPVVLTVNVEDISQRDPNDIRFGEPLDVGIHWSHHQGPGSIEFTRHESTPEPEAQEVPAGAPARFRRGPAPNEVDVKGSGVASVYATFSEPGEYMVRVMVENWSAPDSSQGDQCCWSNAYQRITVR
jgi:hypothetical protein